MTNHPPTEPKPKPHAELWDVLREFFDWARRDIGEPADIARIALIGPEARKLILDWLAPLEALLRRLVFLAAIALQPPQAPSRAHPRPKTKAARRAGSPDPENPAAWPAHFRLLERTGPRRAAANPIRKPRFAALPAGLSSGWPLALRFEALRRGLENPAPLAQRLARLLHKLPHAARALMALPRAHADWRFAASYVAAAADLAAGAAPFFPDTG